MSQSAETIMAGQLSPGERLLWSGRPCGGLRLRPQDAMLIPFSLMWGGFAIFWEMSVIHAHAPFFFKLWGIPFVCIGLYLIFGRFFFDARARESTFYGITNERIIIVNGVFSRQTKSLNLRTLTDVSLTERSDASGTITFGPTLRMGNSFAGGSWPGSNRNAPPAFDLIDRAKEVYEFVRIAQRAIPS